MRGGQEDRWRDEASRAWLLYLARRFDDAIEQLQRSVESGNALSLFWRASAYDAKQLHQLAAQHYEALIDRLGDSPSNQAFLGYALAKRGERRQAETIPKQLEATAEYVSPAELAVLYIGPLGF